MSDYTEISIHCRDEITEILIAELYHYGYEGFWETGNGIKAYIQQNKYNPLPLQNIIEKHILSGEPITYSLLNIPHQNWNEEWEKNFEPVIVAGKYLVRAPFHFVDTSGLTTFTISPKMAFGTGHHATTQLMMELMLTVNLKDKKVLDLGTGTGLLAIFAEHLGAKEVIAIDNAPEAITCTLENIGINNCKNINAFLSEIEFAEKEQFDVVIANINRNTLTEYAVVIANMLKHDDVLLVSGFYENDFEYISTEFKKVNLSFKTSISKNTWVACQFIKS